MLKLTENNSRLGPKNPPKFLIFQKTFVLSKLFLFKNCPCNRGIKTPKSTTNFGDVLAPKCYYLRAYNIYVYTGKPPWTAPFEYPKRTPVGFWVPARSAGIFGTGTPL